MRPLRRALAALPSSCSSGCGGGGGRRRATVSVLVTRDFGGQPVGRSASAGGVTARPLLEVLDARGFDDARGRRSMQAIDGVRAAPGASVVNGVTRRADTRARRSVRRRRPRLVGPPGARRRGVGAGGDRLVPRAVPARAAAASRIPDAGRVRACRRVPSCDATAKRLTALGVVAARGGIDAGTNDETICVCSSAPWRRCAASATRRSAASIAARRRAASAARFSADGRRLDVLDAQGATADTLGAGTGLVAATQIDDRDRRSGSSRGPTRRAPRRPRGARRGDADDGLRARRARRARRRGPGPLSQVPSRAACGSAVPKERADGERRGRAGARGGPQARARAASRSCVESGAGEGGDAPGRRVRRRGRRRSATRGAATSS